MNFITKSSLGVILVFIVLISILLMSACNNSTPKNQINKIEIANDGCLRDCPVVGLIIDSSLTYKYYGGYNATLKGYYEGKVTQAFWDSLNTKLQLINYKTIKTETIGLDGEDIQVIFYWEDQKKKIAKWVGGNNPDSVSSIFKWIINSYKRVQLYKVKDSVKFETTYQFMRPPEPPKPKIDQVLFAPPKKQND